MSDDDVRLLGELKAGQEAARSALERIERAVLILSAGDGVACKQHAADIADLKGSTRRLMSYAIGISSMATAGGTKLLSFLFGG